ncbi:MAG TPA: DUF4214 domain-containing protein [Novosphingobium sp.]|nr:DUF4214 domain-containing protein [Novosphingobium sp.]
MPTNVPSILSLFEANASDFVRDAYAVILGREPDESGAETFEKKLGSGSAANRRKVILALARSPEARARTPLLPIIAREALRIRRWRFLPWNRSAIVMATAQAASQTSMEALVRSIEWQLHAIGERLDRGDWARSGAHHTIPADDRALPLVEHTMRTLKGMSFALTRIESKLDQ